jgi:ParB family chromosome partitioning protein
LIGHDREGDARAISEALHRKLTAHRTKALQVLVADNAPVALASVVHVLLQQVVIEHSYRAESALAIRANDCDGALGQFADDMEGSKAAAELQSRLDAWRERLPGDADKLFAWLLGQDQGTLLDLLALSAALTINTVTASEQGHPGDDIARAVGLDMADFWTASATSYLQQVPKARIVEAVSEAVSAEAGAALAKLKKGAAVVKAEAQLAGTRWLPHALRSR